MNAYDKASRYLAEARLLVEHVQGGVVVATCRGDGEVYRLGHDGVKSWYCTCACRTDQCSHLSALRRVVVRRTPPAPQGDGR